MKQLLFLLLFPCLALAQYQGNANQKITLGEQTTADGLVFRGVANDTNVITPFSDTSAYIILDTVNSKFYHYNRTTTFWALAGGGGDSGGVTSFSAGTTGLTPSTATTGAVTLGGTLAVANGGTGATSLSPNNYLIRTNSSGIFDTSSVYEAGGNVGINTNNPLANLVLFNPTGTSTRFVAGNTNSPTALYSTYLSQGWSIFELYKDGLGSTGSTAFVGGINDASPTSGSATMTFIGYNKAVGTPGTNDLRTHIMIGGLEAVNSGNFQFYTMNSGNISEKLRISASGNVGIGTTSPTQKLHVVGNGLFTGNVTAASFIPTSSTIPTNGMYLHATNTLGFSTNSTTKFLISSGGNLCTDSISKTTSTWKTFELGKGVGTTVLGGRLDGSNQFILGTNWYYDGGTNQEYIGNGFSTQYYQANGEHIMRTAASGSAGANITFTDYYRISTLGESNIVNNTDQGAYNLQVGGTGVWAAGAYVNGSDINVKNNIEYLDSSLNLINSLKPVTYKYNEYFNSDEEYQVGFIAQDVYQNFENKKYVNGIVKSDGEILSMNYSALIPILTKAIQEQQTLIKALEQRIINLENK